MVVKVMACGFCGSDLRTFKSGHARVNPPWIIGHEIAGVVEEIDPSIIHFRVGDRVAVAPPVYCGKCWYCKRGVFYLCVNQREIAQAWPGGLAEYIAIPLEAMVFGSIHHIPQGLSFEEAAISEPASSCVNAHELAGTSLEDVVVVIGAGPIGCFHVEIAKARGARMVVLMDVLEERLRLASAFAPDFLVKSETDSNAHVEKVKELTDGFGASVIVVACPSGEAQKDAITMAAKGGRVLFFGGLPKDQGQVLLDSNAIHYKGLFVIGATTFSPKHHEMALHLFATSKIHAQDYITHLLPLEEFEKGIEALLTGNALKVVFRP